MVEAEARTAEKGCHRRALNRIPDDKSSVLQAALVLRRVPDGQGHLIRRRRQGDYMNGKMLLRMRGSIQLDL